MVKHCFASQKKTKSNRLGQPSRIMWARAERIATVLLQLRNNPELFEKWVKKETAFKADGQPFRRGAAMILE